MEETVIQTSPEQDKNLLEFVVGKLEYEFTRDMLVKPLDEVYVEKIITKPVDTGKKSGGIAEFDTEEVKETVPANFRMGVVLAIPSNYTWADPDNHPEVGDKIAYSRKGAIDFDLFKDAQIVNPYNVVAFIKAKK